MIKKKRSPNAEQLLAIEHQGGVLLRAGAGSGKTFVLVEHITYLTRQWIAEYKKNSQGSFEEFIRSKYSTVVMMTFTKKAAGEMSVRLNKEFAQLALHAESDQPMWATANECLPLLMVTTIDGFCRKLIAGGYLPHLSTEADIIFETQRIDQVKEYLKAWYEKKSHAIPREILDIVTREEKVLLSAFSTIFNDAGLRLAWKKFNIADTHPSKLGELLKKSFDLGDISHALLAINALDLPEEKERSAFERFVALVQATGLPEVDNVEKLAIYGALFEGKRLNPESTGSKKGLDSHKNAHAGLKALRDWQKKWLVNVTEYTTHYESKIVPWIKLCQELYAWIEERLDPNLGMTFGDVSYYVALGLENTADRERINKAYRYFIVDEFQDTSALQFNIIRNLIGSDFQRLFCVGDAKQAIYGFRGGELSVFRDCAELVPQVRSLANNYRSLPEVINFNNSLFRTIMPLGQGFTGVDAFSVDPEDQNVPASEETPAKGTVEIISANLERDLAEEGKFSPADINRLEAHLLAENISYDRATRPEEVCTILYTKLTPSTFLIKNLMDRKIGFTAQYKIDLLDDPIMGMFLALLKRQFDTNKETKDRYPLFILKSYLKVLGIDRELKAADLEAFDANVIFWGLLEAFHKFMHHLQISNENADINIGVIESLSEIFHQQPEAIMVQISGDNNDRISLDLRSGENSHMVQIMTAHASKGLEFDTVYLGGIYTNGKEMNDGSLFGQMPASFKWYQDLSQREKLSSPFYVYENELADYKNFSEAKRLFYVACTRAKKKLGWVSFTIPEKTFSIPENSWIDGLNAWLNLTQDRDCLKAIVTKNVIGFDNRELLGGETTPKLPLFFHDPVGIFCKGELESELAIAAELSVTRLNSLIDCPRKFYLQNVLKLNTHINQTFSKPEMIGEVEEELATVMKSSAERGTEIHALIAKGIDHNFIVPREAMNSPMAKPIGWALQELSPLQGQYQMLAEKPVKFKFFNFMISGIPDLLLIPKKEGTAQIWDFKTGRITQDSLNHYWVQLKAYAYALYVLKSVPLSDSIETKLCFVDEEKIITLKVSWNEIQTELFSLWRKQNEPWSIKTDHCGQCSYGDICPR